MRRVRRQRPPADLRDRSYAELTRMATRGEISWSAVQDITHEQVVEMFGGVDPYAHLRPADAS